jgi:phosphoribosyl 1,2-cyclic phosphate phosphodiesterase
VYATETAWKSIEARFGYLLGSLLEKRLAIPGKHLEGLVTRVTPFKTFHGPSAPGSVGYAIEESSTLGDTKLVYTSDFMQLDEEPIVMEPTVLVMQSHWFNEPRNNRPHQMSFQRALDYIRRWKPSGATYLVHMSAGDLVPGDPKNDILKKLEPMEPLAHPETGQAYPVPRCQEEWQSVVEKIRRDYGIDGPVLVPEDGMKVEI